MQRLRAQQPDPEPDFRGLSQDEALKVAAEAMLGPWRDLYLKDPSRPERNIAEAHVHAMLAQAAATAVKTEADQEAWISVVGTTPSLGGGGPERPDIRGITPAWPGTTPSPGGGSWPAGY